MRNLLALLFLLSSISVFSQIPEQKDDPAARMRFDLMRLKNPSTNEIPENIFQLERQLMQRRQNELARSRVEMGVADNWVNRGPFNVGGRTRALAIDMSDPTDSTILAGGVSGGLWRTVDGGQSWTKQTNSLDLQSITCLAQDPRPGSQNIWYYGTGETRGNSASAAAFSAFYRGDGIFKSIDGGITWSLLSATSTNLPQVNDNPFGYTHEVVVNPVNGDLLVATQSGIFRSQDGGSSFSLLLSGSGWSEIAATSQGILYAHIEEVGFFRSSDNGDSWSNITDPLIPIVNGDRGEIAIAPSNEDIIYVIGEDSSDPDNPDHYLWKFNDSTQVWTNLSAHIPRLGGRTGDFTSQGGYDLLIKVSPADTSLVIIGGTNLFRSTDGFSTTSNTTWVGGYTANNTNFALYSNHHPDQHTFVFLDSTRALSGNDGGVQYTEDILDETARGNNESVSWIPLNNGYLTSQIYAVSAGPEDQLMIGLQDNGTWFANNATDLTDEWTTPFGGDGAYSAIANNGSARFLSSQNANIGVFNFSGGPEDQTAETGWVFRPSEEDGYRTLLFITPFYLDPANNDLFYLGGDTSLWVNTQATSTENVVQGANQGWKSISFPEETEGIISEFGIGPQEVVYFGTSSGNVVKVMNADSDTATVEDVTGPNLPGGYISGVGVNPFDPDKVLVSFSNYEIPSLFYSEDGGSTWVDVSGNLEENPDGSGNGPSVRVARIHGNDIRFYAGTSTGLYSTAILDGQNTVWVRENEQGIGSTVVEHMVTREDGLVVAATHGNGIFSATVPLLETDLGIVSIDSLTSGLYEETETPVYVTLENVGSATVSGFQLSLFLDSVLVVSDDITESFPGVSNYQHVFSEAIDISASGSYEISVRLTLAGDESESNDSTAITINSWAIPTDILLSNNTISEGRPSGTDIGALEAVDDDGQTHSFKFEEGEGSDDNTSFRLIGKTLRSNASFDFANKPAYTIRIITTDEEGNTFAKAFQIDVLDVLGQQEWDRHGLTVFPNPTKSRITLEMINDYRGEVKLRLLSQDGKEIVLQNTYPKTQKSTQSLLDVSSLPDGIYFLQVSYGDKVVSTRLIKE